MVQLEINWRRKLKPLIDPAFHNIFLENTTDKLRLDFVQPYLFYFLWSRLDLDEPIVDSC